MEVSRQGEEGEEVFKVKDSSVSYVIFLNLYGSKALKLNYVIIKNL